MNVGEDALLYRFMKRVSRWVYRRADMLIYSSKRFQGYLRDVHGIEVPDAQYMPQFADDVFRAPLPPKPASKVVNLVFAGNIGKVQAVEVLIRAAALLRDLPIRWHIVGDGSNEAACRELAASQGLGDTVVFYGRRPLEDMPAFYAMADAMLVSMRDDISVNDTLPGKVQSYMAAGKPVLGSIAGETAYVVEQAGCGFCAPPDDPEAFAQVVRRFLSCTDREAMGERGRAYYDAHFTKRDHMDRLEALLTFACGRGIRCGSFSLTPIVALKARVVSRWTSPGWWRRMAARAKSATAFPTLRPRQSPMPFAWASPGSASCMAPRESCWMPRATEACWGRWDSSGRWNAFVPM